MLIRKALAGAITGYHWNRNGDVVEVPDHIAEEILRIPNGGFSVAASMWEPPAEAQYYEPNPPLLPEEMEPKPPRGRPPMPRDDKGRILRNK